MEKAINYSIIIPHKNIPDLLRRCLNSIPRREDIQIIVVDDNSDSNIVDFEHFPGMGEPCVEVVFTKEGKGAGYARNVGLSKAKGKWLLFADADDFFCEFLLQNIDKYLNANVDVVYFKAQSVDSDTLLPADR
ncbi:putative glycosyltransferase EpsJ, partial [termite gut metagenome]